MFDVQSLRRQFPALQRWVNGQMPIFLDGPGGTQTPQRVIDAVADYLGRCNANHGGVFTTSRESDRILHEAHEAVADLLNAPSADEIIFGQNMTSLTLHLSRAFGKTLKPGDQVLVTRLDHDANISPWLLAARDAAADTAFVDIRPEDCTFDLDDLRRTALAHEPVRAIEKFLRFPGSFPVDVRHNAKIFREKIAAWAARALR